MGFDYRWTPSEGFVTIIGLVNSMSINLLQLPMLVLNRNWQPVNVATVARVLVLLWNGAARVVEVAGDHRGNGARHNLRGKMRTTIAAIVSGQPPSERPPALGRRNALLSVPVRGA
jgi:hypothetical protein